MAHSKMPVPMPQLFPSLFALMLTYFTVLKILNTPFYFFQATLGLRLLTTIVDPSLPACRLPKTLGAVFKISNTEGSKSLNPWGYFKSLFLELSFTHFKALWTCSPSGSFLMSGWGGVPSHIYSQSLMLSSQILSFLIQ